jgi:2-amino-4-hydroxy-6-hydroxymethyldihydropteridine diphosphokinase
VVAFLGLGSNVGERRGHLGRALRSLSPYGNVVDISSVWETEPVGYADQADFWNLVVKLQTRLAPAELLTGCKTVERSVGRTPGFRNGPREIDIDVLLYHDIRLETGSLHLPHPRMTRRAFVLRPLEELAPNLVIPGTDATVDAILATEGPFEAAARLFPGLSLLDA